MNAAARAKTPGIKRRSKTAANPWQWLPRLADLFDRATRQPFFKGSKVPGLEELALTETQLLEQTAALLGVSLAQLLRTGALVYAKRELLNHKKYSTAAEGDPEAALLRSGSGVPEQHAGLIARNPWRGYSIAKTLLKKLPRYVLISCQGRSGKLGSWHRQSPKARQTPT